MKIIITAVKERKSYVDYLLKNLPFPIVLYDDNNENIPNNYKAKANFLKALGETKGEKAIIMEDDILLTKDFFHKAIIEINKKPNVLIQFFSMRKNDLEIGSRLDNNFLMNQCFYLPRGYGMEIIEFEKTRDKESEHFGASDILMRDFLKSRKEKYWIHVPSLVQHRIAKSVIDQRRSSKRQSLTFIDPIVDGVAT